MLDVNMDNGHGHGPRQLHGTPAAWHMYISMVSGSSMNHGHPHGFGRQHVPPTWVMALCFIRTMDPHMASSCMDHKHQHGLR